MRSKATAALAALAIAAAWVPLSAHRLDEYLQAARVGIDPDRVTVELDLTAGVAVAERVLADIDRDRDGRISTAEAHAYVDRVVSALVFDIDGVPLPAHVTGTHFPDVDTIRAGEGTIRIDVAARMTRLSGGAHHFHFRNTHRGDISVYMANALVPSDDRVRISDQQRDGDQRTLDVGYVLTDATDGWSSKIMKAIGIVFSVTVLAFAMPVQDGGRQGPPGAAARICRTLTRRNAVGCRIVQPGGDS